MNRTGTIFLLAMSFAVLDARALEARQSPYDKIAERNLFQLRAAPVSHAEPPIVKHLLKVTLTGITTILGRPAAFITIEGIKSQPPESVMLMNGQAVNGIEIKGIDEKAGVVKILNGDELQILNFEPAHSSGMVVNSALIAPPLARPPVPAQFEATMTPEEQTALIELQRIKFQQEGDPIQAILPTTELTANDKVSTSP